LAKIIFPGKLIVSEESWWRFLPLDNWVMRVLSGECCEAVERIIRAFWFFFIPAFYFLERALEL